MMTENPLIEIDIGGIKYPVYQLLSASQAQEFRRLVDVTYDLRDNLTKAGKSLSELVGMGVYIVTFCLRMDEKQASETPGLILDMLMDRIVNASLENAKLTKV